MPSTKKPKATQSTDNPPKVVLLGRTNAGKSTLFNRLTEHGKAIVSPLENTTRDQNRDIIYWKGNMCELIDTGGLDTAAADTLNQDIQNQVYAALKNAAAAIVVVDGKHGVMPQDHTLAKWIRTQHIPIVLCINKIDKPKWRIAAEAEFAVLNLTPSITCSAISGAGTADLLDALFKIIPQYEAPEAPDETRLINIALVGRPNVGKSSLFNALLGEPRVIVSDIAHTTRDINDTELIYKDQTLRIIDTAGIRRKNRVGDWSNTIDKQQTKHLAGVERTGIHTALQMIQRSNVVLLMIEAQKKITKQDKALVHYAQHNGKGLVIVINKWDLIPDKTPTTINEYKKYFSHHLGFAAHTPVIFISALEEQRVHDVLDVALEVYGDRHRWATEEQLAAILEALQQSKPYQTRFHAAMKRKLLVIKNITQTGVNPPSFELVTPTPKLVAESVIDIAKKHIQETCAYHGVDIRLEIVKAA